MIIETEKLDYKSLVLPETLKFEKKVFDKVLTEIQKNEKRPFGKLYVFILLPLFPDMITFLKNHDISIKSLITDQKMLRLEF
jgi:hypothetical protein